MEREGNGRAAMNDENLIRSLQIVLSSVSVGYSWALRARTNEGRVLRLAPAKSIWCSCVVQCKPVCSHHWVMPTIVTGVYLKI